MNSLQHTDISGSCSKPAIELIGPHNHNHHLHHHHHHHLNHSHQLNQLSHHLTHLNNYIVKQEPTSNEAVAQVKPEVEPTTLYHQNKNQQQQQQTQSVYQKRHRTTFNQFQLTILEEAFKQNSYPSPSFRDGLAKQIGLDSSRIQVWFQNRRAKQKKQISQAMRCFATATSCSSNNLVSEAPSPVPVQLSSPQEKLLFDEQRSPHVVANQIEHCVALQQHMALNLHLSSSVANSLHQYSPNSGSQPATRAPSANQAFSNIEQQQHQHRYENNEVPIIAMTEHNPNIGTSLDLQLQLQLHGDESGETNCTNSNRESQASGNLLYGNRSWLNSHHNCGSLNQQAHQQMQSNHHHRLY